MSMKRIKAKPEEDWAASHSIRYYVGDKWTLPADAESYERMVEQIGAPLAKLRNGATWPMSANDAARAALKSIGITAPKKGSK